MTKDDIVISYGMMFLKLDEVDQARTIERMKALLEDEKYSVKVKIIKQEGNITFIDFQSTAQN